MLPLLHPAALHRLVRPQAGAVANVTDALRDLAVVAQERYELAVVQAGALGVDSWERLPHRPRAARHALQLSEDDAELVGQLAPFVVEGLAAGEVCVVALTASHLAGLRLRLDLAGLGDSAARLLVPVDADAELGRVLREGRPDPALFEQHVAGPLRHRVRTGQRPRVAGEMAGTLVRRADLAGALEVEELWASLQAELGFPLLCVHPALDDDGFHEQVLAQHSHAVAAVG